MARTVQISAPTYAVERAVLPNGLRVVLAPDSAAPVVTVAAYYDVGIRSEPEGRTGFAHLFEHLMFQGSASLPKLEHFRYVQASGGIFNGSTHLDYTNYFEMLPSNALERALFLEADRMLSPRITEENLANQIAVVKEEIRVNVLNRPYGAFPWLQLPPVMFDTFPNAHNGYGDFVDLESATVADAADFFDRYYTPGNAVLAVGGDLDVDQTMGWIEHYYGDIPGRKMPARQDFSEPDLTAERRAVETDPLAPAPAVALAWRVPDPINDLAAYLPYVLLAEVLTDGDASRLRRRLLRGDRIATSLQGYLGFMGDPFDVRDPTALLLEAHHPDAVPVDRIVDTIAEELDRLGSDGIDADELRRVQARLATQLLRPMDSVLGRTLTMAVLEQQHGRAELSGELSAMLGQVTPAEVQVAAQQLRPDRRAVLELKAGGAR